MVVGPVSRPAGMSEPGWPPGKLRSTQSAARRKYLAVRFTRWMYRFGCTAPSTPHFDHNQQPTQGKRCTIHGRAILSELTLRFVVTAGSSYLQSLKMSYVAKGGEKDYEAGGLPPPKSHRIRITLTSKNVKALEKGNTSCCPIVSAFLLIFSHPPL